MKTYKTNATVLGLPRGATFDSSDPYYDKMVGSGYLTEVESDGGEPGAGADGSVDEGSAEGSDQGAERSTEEVSS